MRCSLDLFLRSLRSRKERNSLRRLWMAPRRLCLFAVSRRKARRAERMVFMSAPSRSFDLIDSMEEAEEEEELDEEEVEE